MKTKKDIGILFDYNGVIVDDEALHEQAFGTVLNQYGIKFTLQLYAQYFYGRTDQEGFERLRSLFAKKLAGLPISRLLKDKQRAYLSLLGQEPILYPGALSIIKELARVARLGLVTSTTYAELHKIVKRYHLNHYFSFFVTAEDVRKGKPNPEGYLKAIEKMKMMTDRIVVVEDSPSGVAAAKAAGLKCIAVLHTSPKHKLKKADYIVRSIQNLSPYFIEKVFEKKIR